MLWICPKLWRYCSGVIKFINGAFNTVVSLDPKQCTLGMLDGMVPQDQIRNAISKALFQTHELILQCWKSYNPSNSKECICHIGNTRWIERLIYTQGCRAKFGKVWQGWLNTLGLSTNNLLLLWCNSYHMLAYHYIALPSNLCMLQCMIVKHCELSYSEACPGPSLKG